MSDFTYNSFPIPAKPLSGVGETSYLSALLGIAPGGVKKVPTASFLAAAGVYPVALLQCTPQITQVIGDVAASTTLIPLIADTSVSGGDTGVSTGGMSVGDTSPNSGKIVISEAGLYRVSCSIRITRTSSDGGECGAVIMKNGSSVITSVYDEADTDDHFTLTCPTVIASLASGDVLSLNAAIVGGSSESIYVNGASLLPEDVPAPTSVVLIERLNSASGDSSSTESLAELAAEVQDAREGYDGTTYASLGAAIRSQVAMAMAQGIKESVKQALLQLASKVAYIDNGGSGYYQDLYDALYEKDVVSISAVFDQTDVTIYQDYSLDQLKPYLTVTALYDDSSTGTITAYTLSGTLTIGTSTITVTYEGKQTTFSVTVSERLLLYKDGDECTSVTGGWTNHGFKQNTGVTSYSKSNNKLRLALTAKASSTCANALSTVNKINLVNYSKITIVCSTKRMDDNCNFWLYFGSQLADATSIAGAYGSTYTREYIGANAAGEVQNRVVQGNVGDGQAPPKNGECYLSLNINAWGNSPAGAYCEISEIYVTP